jgi:hypothetical protein
MSYQRNPWTGINAWKEFKYDMRHPLVFLRRALAGLRGEIPQVPKLHRAVGGAAVVVGLANVLVFTALEIVK